jgi:ADP-heptose:LPS heptosyltransferase
VGSKIFVGKPLGAVAALVGEAEGVLANDSGIGHIAAAMGRRTAVIFTGVTDPRICGPLGPADKVSVFAPDVTPAHVARHIAGR